VNSGVCSEQEFV